MPPELCVVMALLCTSGEHEDYMMTANKTTVDVIYSTVHCL